MNTTYLSCAETAKLVRAALKRHFPSVKFSVKSHTYSGGASIDVKWTDGPATSMVDAVVGQFAASDFDGSIDMKVSRSCWLLPDGTAVTASNPGTEGSRGCIPAERNWMPEPDAKLVHFGADFIFTRREITPALLRRVRDRLAHKGYPVEVIEIREGAGGYGYVYQTTFDREQTRGFDMEREMHMAVGRTHCTTGSK